MLLKLAVRKTSSTGTRTGDGARLQRQYLPRMRVRMLPVLAAMTVVASGCAGGGEPEVTAAPLPPATGTPSPTAAAPAAVEVPDEATAATAEGAAAFAAYYAEEVHQAYRSLDPARVKRLSAQTCETCQRYITTIEEIKESGARISTSYTLEVLDVVAPVELPDAAQTTVAVFLRIGEFVVTAADGQVLVREEASEQAVQSVTLGRADDAWITLSVTND